MVRPRPTVLGDDLSVITFRDGAGLGHFGKDLLTFEDSLRCWGLGCTVLGVGVSGWTNRMKVPLLRAHLPSVSSSYVLVCDSADVVLARPLGGIVGDFVGFGAGAVFNGERLSWPFDPVAAGFEESVCGGGDYPHLNAGVWMARTDFAMEVLGEWGRVPLPAGGSEQAFYKAVYRLFHPRIRVDHTCRLFQNLNRVYERFTWRDGLLLC